METMERGEGSSFAICCREGWKDRAAQMVNTVTNEEAAYGLMGALTARRIDLADWIMKKRPSVAEFIDFDGLIVSMHIAGAETEVLKWVITRFSTKILSKTLAQIYVTDYCTEETKLMLDEVFDKRG